MASRDFAKEYKKLLKEEKARRPAGKGKSTSKDELFQQQFKKLLKESMEAQQEEKQLEPERQDLPKQEEKIQIIEGSRFIKKVNPKTGEVSYKEFKGKTSQALIDQLAKAKMAPKAEEKKASRDFAKEYKKLLKEEKERRPAGKGKYKSTSGDELYQQQFKKLLKESMEAQQEELANEPVKKKKQLNITKKAIIRKNVDIPEAIIEEIPEAIIEEMPEKKISVKSKTEKMSRKPTAYNIFFKEHYDSTSGTPQERMKQIAEMYNRHKAGKPLTKAPIKKTVVNITKAENPFAKMSKASKAIEKELPAIAPKQSTRKQRPADYIPPSILKGMPPELVKKLRKFYNPTKEYSLADELAEIGEL